MEILQQKRVVQGKLFKNKDLNLKYFMGMPKQGNFYF